MSAQPSSIQVRRLPILKHWLLTGLVLVALVFALGLIVQLSPGITSDELAVDQSFSRSHSSALTGLALVLNVLFAPVAGALVVLGGSLYLLLVKRSPQTALVFALLVGCGWVTCQLFKVVIGRIRPDPTLLFDPLVPEPASNSFPSGHTSLAVALVVAVYLLVRGSRWAKPVLWGGLFLALLVAWSRVYIGAHYPMDVLASFPAAAAAVIISAGLWNRHAAALVVRLRPQPKFPRTPDRK